MCTAQLNYTASVVALCASLPVAFYVKKTWPLLLGFVGGTIADMWKWQQCLNSSPEAIRAELKVALHFAVEGRCLFEL